MRALVFERTSVWKNQGFLDRLCVSGIDVDYNNKEGLATTPNEIAITTNRRNRLEALQRYVMKVIARFTR